jgi:hypothetical protein
VFENRVLRKIFGPMRNEVTGEWRKLHNEELCDLYSSPSIIRITKSRRMRWAGHVARMEKRNAYRLLVGKRLLGRPRRMWLDNIKMNLGEVAWGDVDWIGLTQHRNRWRALMNLVMKLSGSMLGNYRVASQLVAPYKRKSIYEGGPKNNRNRPVAHACFLVTSCATG